MTQREHDDNVPGLDALRKTYRAASFTDEPPPHVDAFIRAAAKRADRRRFRTYVPPLAMAATIVLAFGLVLRLTTFGPAPADRPSQAIEQLAPRAAEPALTEEETASDLGASASPAPLPSVREQAPAEEGVASAASADAATPTRASPASPSAAPPGERPTAAEQRAQAVTVQVRALPSCADPRREGPEAWLACIAAEVDAGTLDAARTELDAFRREFPDYAVPEPLATALAP